MGRIETFQRMLDQGQDSPLLRFSLGREHLNADDAAQAVVHLAAAVEQDPAYSAAWRELGRARERNGEPAGAVEAYRQGIEAAENAGDKQAAREMQVFLRRLAKQGHE